MNQLLFDISVNGKIPENINWNYLLIFLELKMKDECILMNEKYQDLNDNFSTNFDNFEDLLKDLLELLESFQNKPMFTLQRLCELLFEAEKYYKSSKRFLFALEKILAISPEEYD